MSEQYRLFPKGIETHAEAAYYMMDKLWVSIDKYHRGYVRRHLGSYCLLAARRVEGRTEVHGFVFDADMSTLTLESHHPASGDENYKHAAYRQCFMSPDGSCENITLNNRSLSYEHLHSGLALPQVRNDTAYHLLDSRIRLLNPRYKPDRALSTRSGIVGHLTKMIVHGYGHTFRNPALQAMSTDILQGH